MNIPNIIAGILSPVRDFAVKRQERKMARETATAKLSQAKVAGEQQVTFNDQELEVALAAQKTGTWTDEYITVSIISVFNLIVLGGILSAFGFPSLLEGTALAITALTEANVDVAFLMEATVLAGLGLVIWRKI